MHKSDAAPTYGRKVTYLEASKGGFRKFLQHVADGNYWRVSQDFGDGSVFDSPAMQRAKAAAMIVELDKKAEQIPDPQSLDGNAALMLLEFDADVKFGNSIRKPTDASSKQIQPAEYAGTESEDSNQPLSGEEKLRQAKAFAKGMQYVPPSGE